MDDEELELPRDDEPEEKNGGKTVSFDAYFKAAKSFGRYQFFFFAIMQIDSWSHAANIISGFYSVGGSVPDYECRDPGNEWYLKATDIRKQTKSLEYCQMVHNCSALTTHNVWRSMYEDFDWICADEHWRSGFVSAQTVFSFVVMLASGHLIDWAGRRLPLIIASLLAILLYIAKSYTTNFTQYAILSLVGHLFSPISGGASFSLIIESVPAKYRLTQSLCFQYAIGFMWAGATALLVRDWRAHIRLNAGLGLICWILTLFLYESPRLLVQKKKFAEAANVMNKIARFNGVKGQVATEEDMQRIHQQTSNTKRIHFSLLDIFRHKRLCVYMLAQALTGVAMNLIYSTITFNIQDLSGNPLTNFILLGALRSWVPFAVVAVERWRPIPRKRLLVVGQFIVCVCFAIITVISIAGKWEEWQVLATVCALIGNAVESSFVWIAYKLLSTEVFPTVVRTVALQAISTIAMMSGVISPQLVMLRTHWHAWPYIATTIVTGAATLAAVLLLPETLGRPLPDSFAEVILTNKVDEMEVGNGNAEQTVPLKGDKK